MALVRAHPQLLVETNDKKSIGYEADGRKVALASIDSMAGIQGDMNLAVAASRDASLSDNGNIPVYYTNLTMPTIYRVYISVGTASFKKKKQRQPKKLEIT